MSTLSSSNQIFYIIRRPPPWAGFFSNFLYVLGHIIVAEEKNYTPIVDMVHYKTFYNEPYLLHNTYNAWEYYFYPLCDTPLEEVYQNQSFVLSTFQYQFDKVQYTNEHYNFELPSPLTLRILSPYIKKYILFKPHIMAILDHWDTQLKNYKKLLGVHIRGTDMNYTPDHPKQPALETLLNHTQQLMTTQQIDGIFICSDEEKSINAFKAQFGSKVFHTLAYRTTKDDHIGIHTDLRDIPRHNHHYLLGEEVLIDMVLLSKCHILLSGISNVPYVACLFNGGQYEQVISLK